MKLNAAARITQIKAAQLEDKEAEKLIKKYFPKADVATIPRTNGGCQGSIDTKAKAITYGQLELLAEAGLQLKNIQVSGDNIRIDFIAA